MKPPKRSKRQLCFVPILIHRRALAPIVVAAVQALEHLVVGRTLEEITADLRGFWRSLASEGQLRWLGPEKGVIHLATAAVVNAVYPAGSCVSGEIIAAWDLRESTVKQALAQRVLAAASPAIAITPLHAPGHPRLRGAAARVTAPLFAAPRVG